jgi:hypothetical protein
MGAYHAYKSAHIQNSLCGLNGCMEFFPSYPVLVFKLLSCVVSFSKIEEMLSLAILLGILQLVKQALPLKYKLNIH